MKPTTLALVFLGSVTAACNGTGPGDGAPPDATTDASITDVPRTPVDTGPGFDAPPPTCTVDAGAAPAGDAGGHVVQLALGDRHSCALLDDATVRCWGSNNLGQLGDGTQQSRAVPTPVTLLGPVSQLAAGGDHTCAVTTSQQVYCWGANESGQLGDGTHTTRLVPTLATLASGAAVDAVEVEAGAQHTCARAQGGGVFCWGANTEGQLADGTVTTRLQSQGALVSATHVAQLSAGTIDTCAVTMGGAALCWGNDDEGQLGNCQFSAPQTSAVPVVLPLDTGTTQPLTGVAEISVALVHACARMADGTVMCWGNGVEGQLGYTVPITGECHEPMGFGNQFPAAKQVPGLAHARQIATGGTSSCAVLADGTLWCWGANLDGQLGLCTNASVPVATQVSIPGSAAEVRLGADHGCVRRFTGDVLCWGNNEDGRLGDGTVISRRAPGFVLF